MIEDLINAMELVSEGPRGHLPRALRPHARKIFDRHAAWSRQANVVGFGVARRRVGGVRTADFTMKVFVERKLPLSRCEHPVPMSIKVPGIAGPVPIDIEAVGQVRLHGNHAEKRPAYGGIGISHEKGPPGTLGCLVRSRANPNDIFVLGNAHVLARAGFAAAGDRILQPALHFGGGDDDVIATLERWTALSPGDGHPNVVDAALARAVPGTISARIGQDNLFVKGVSGIVNEGDMVQMCGATSGTVRARVICGHAKLRVPMERLDGIKAELGFRDQVLCERLGQQGDSGALVLDTAGEHAVGLYFAGSESHGYFNRITNVLGIWPDLDLELVGTDPWPVPVAAAAGDEPPPVQDRKRARDVLARTLWGEARGQKEAGIRAVAAVIANRARRRPAHWWGDTVEGVCLHSKQFSCWNDDDPNLPKLKAVTAADAQFQLCLDIAERALAGTLADPTARATHYHRFDMAPFPKWTLGKTPCARIGEHVFYNTIE